MRILILTFYFPPDLSAGSFRMSALVDELKRRMSEHDAIDILTTLPNRYHSYSARSPQDEQSGNVNIHRVKIPAHKSGLLDQSRAFAYFAAGAWCVSRARTYDLVFSSSSRLFTGFLGAVISRQRKIPFHLDLRDIFTQTIADVLGRSFLRVLVPGFRRIERFTIRSARRITLASEGFCEYFRGIDPSKDYHVFTNGIDEEFIGDAFSEPVKLGRKQILYAGNIGASQGLHRIIPDIAHSLDKDYEFVLVGDGGARHLLEAAMRDKNVSNVRILPPVERNRLVDLYKQADVLFLHLNDHDAFYKVLPSKLFEYAAMGKPIVAGVAGYPAHFINSNIENAAVFEPCNVTQCLAAIRKINLTVTPRKEFVRRFRRKTIMQKFADEILKDVTSLKNRGSQQPNNMSKT